MLDDLNPREGRSEPGRDRPRSVPSRPFADREVPRGTRRTPQTVQAWLGVDSTLIGESRSRSWKIGQRL